MTKDRPDQTRQVKMGTTTGLKTLNAVSPLSRELRHSRTSLLHPLRRKSSPLSLSSRHLTVSPLCCSISGSGNGTCLSVSQESSNRLLQVVLVSPQIPGNTGCIARTCAASSVGLHLVGPLGFRIDDAKLKRAGLDYWPYVVVKVHDSWAEFRNYFRQQEGDKRLLALTKRGVNTHSDFSYRKGDYLVFGSETSGLPPEALQDCNSVTLGGGTIRIPMVDTYVRCLNLSVSVGIALYEAARQLNYEQLQLPSETCISNNQVFIEDIFS